MIGECNRQKHSRRALRLNISSVDIRGACCFRASCVHNVLAVKFAMRHCKQCVSNEASKRSRGPVRNWDVNFSSFRMCLPWHVPTALIALSLSISFSLSFLAPTRFFNFFFFSSFLPIRVIRTDEISTMQTWIVTRVIWVIVYICVEDKMNRRVLRVLRVHYSPSNVI